MAPLSKEAAEALLNSKFLDSFPSPPPPPTQRTFPSLPPTPTRSNSYHRPQRAPIPSAPRGTGSADLLGSMRSSKGRSRGRVSEWASTGDDVASSASDTSTIRSVVKETYVVPAISSRDPIKTARHHSSSFSARNARPSGHAGEELRLPPLYPLYTTSPLSGKSSSTVHDALAARAANAEAQLAAALAREKKLHERIRILEARETQVKTERERFGNQVDAMKGIMVKQLVEMDRLEVSATRAEAEVTRVMRAGETREQNTLREVEKIWRHLKTDYDTLWEAYTRLSTLAERLSRVANTQLAPRAAALGTNGDASYEHLAAVLFKVERLATRQPLPDSIIAQLLPELARLWRLALAKDCQAAANHQGQAVLATSHKQSGAEAMADRITQLIESDEQVCPDCRKMIAPLIEEAQGEMKRRFER